MSRRNKRDGVYDAWRGNPAIAKLNLRERMYLRIFTEIACARFKWEGLPEEIDVRFLELTLFRNAVSVFFKNTDFDKYMALRGTGHGIWNAYDNPTSFTVYGNQEILQKELAYGRNNKQCVPIWANYLREPDLDIATLFAPQLAEIDQTISINARAMRKPFVVAVDESERLTFQNVMRQQEEGQAVIFGTRALTGITEKVQLLDMRIDSKYVLDLQVAKSKMWNECMTFLGINNSNQEKRERVVVSEVSANNSQVLMARNVALNARRHACEEINSLYPDLSISVDWNVDVDEIAQEREINAEVIDV